jgi:hypothetical protein
MEKPYKIHVFGKQGCDKCSLLNQRLDKLLSRDEWEDFEKLYCDLGTESGLVAFSEAECINPQRIPAMLVTRRNDKTGEYEPLPNPDPGKADGLCGKSKLHQYLGLQTDYGETGRGVIAPKMIESVLKEARV